MRSAADFEETISRCTDLDRISIKEHSTDLEMRVFSVTDEEIRHFDGEVVSLNPPIEMIETNETTLRLLYECLTELFEDGEPNDE